MNKQKIILILVMVLIAVVFCSLGIIIGKLKPATLELYYDNFNIEYIGLNETEIEIVEDAIWDLQSSYKTLAQQVIISNNKTENKYMRGMINVNGNNWRGININNGEKIYIIYDGNPCDLRTTLCHELIHSLLDENKVFNEEDFAYPMGKIGVCYANPVCEFNDSIVSTYSMKFIKCEGDLY